MTTQTTPDTTAAIEQALVRSSETIEQEADAFDAYALQYEEALNEGLSISGEGPEHFANRRIEWVAKILNGHKIDHVLDFGCGVGIATPMIQRSFSPTQLVGFDPSTQAIARAKRDFGSDGAKFTSSPGQLRQGEFDLAYCNGVFHHILPADRPLAFQTVLDSLKPGGHFAFWENNPWNPGTRYVMSKIPFDRDAVVISPPEAKSLLAEAGFEIAKCHSRFLFPRSLSWLRPIENLFYKLPIGAQYLVLARKPVN